jgi:hypothetical protein
MSRRPDSLFVLLTLLAALWQPLCWCRGARAEARDAVASCCDSQERTPQPNAPCEEHGDDCACGQDVRLVPVEGAGPVQLPLALLCELPSSVVEPPRVAWVPLAARHSGRSPAPPGRPGVLPLRI